MHKIRHSGENISVIQTTQVFFHDYKDIFIMVNTDIHRQCQFKKQCPTPLKKHGLSLRERFFNQYALVKLLT